MMVWILGRNKQMKMLQIRGGGVMVMMARAWNCKSESSKTATNRMQAEAASLRLRCCLGLSPPKNNVVGRCFQSRAEYMDWTQRMIASRFTVEHVEMDDEQERQRQTQTRLRRVPVKVAAPFLYSVSPISDRLLLFESEPKRIDAIGSSPTTNGTPGSDVRSLVPVLKFIHDNKYIAPDKDNNMIRGPKQVLDAARKSVESNEPLGGRLEEDFLHFMSRVGSKI